MEFHEVKTVIEAFDEIGSIVKLDEAQLSQILHLLHDVWQDGYEEARSEFDDMR